MATDTLYTRSFVFCFLTNFAQSVSFSLLYLHFPGFLKELGAGEATIGVIASLTALSAVVLGPFFGRFVDRHGRLGIIFAGHVMNIAIAGLYLTFDALGPFVYAVRMLHGVAETMLHTSLFAYAADHIPSARTAQGLAFFGVSAQLSLTTGGVLGDVVVRWGGYPALFLTSLGFAVIGMILAIPLPSSVGPGDAEPPRPFRATLLQRDLAPLWTVTWLFFVAMAGVFTFFKTYVMATGLSTVGTFWAIYTLTAVVQRLTLGWVPDRLGLQRMLAPALLFYGLGVALLAGATQDWMIWLAGLGCGLGHGFGYPILLGLVTRRARDTERGAAMAIYTAIDDGAILIAGPMLGLVIEYQGYTAMYSGCAVLLAGTALLYGIWDRAPAERS